jgi:hypothetical protein
MDTIYANKGNTKHQDQPKLKKKKRDTGYESEHQILSRIRILKVRIENAESLIINTYSPAIPQN